MLRNLVILGGKGGELDGLAGALRDCSGAEAEVTILSSLERLLQRMQAGEPIDLVVVDYALGDGELGGREVVSRIREVDRDLPVVVVAEQADVDIVAESVRAGATDFLVRGARLAERVRTLLGKLARVFRLRELAERSAETQLRDARWCMVGASPQIEKVRASIARVARIPRPVLITGERGTGKELVARAIHVAGGAPTRPMVIANCAAFAEGLLESELFGHEKGSFTGASHTAQGRFEQADGGTLFLDEIGNMPLAFQKKVLRVVEYGTLTRVGGRSEIGIQVRILAATNVDLAGKIASGEFLADLYDRLAFEVIHLPPLRERPDDIAVLAEHFLERFALEIPALRGKRLSRSALEALQRYRFPGNLRELKNVIERAACHETGPEISAEELGLPAAVAGGTAVGVAGTFRERVALLERGLLVEALRDAGGNQAEAARRLGLSYHQFRYYARKHAVE